MNINAVPFSDQPLQGVNVVIEVQVDAEPNKYGIDKRSGVLFIDRYLYLQCVTLETMVSDLTHYLKTETPLMYWSHFDL